VRGSKELQCWAVTSYWLPGDERRQTLFSLQMQFPSKHVYNQSSEDEKPQRRKLRTRRICQDEEDYVPEDWPSNTIQNKSNRCTLEACPLCQNDEYSMDNNNNVLSEQGWREIVERCFESIYLIYPKKLWLYLPSDVYYFLESHWHILCGSKSKDENWKKRLQDTLSHNKGTFVSGRDRKHKTGFWCLKEKLFKADKLNQLESCSPDLFTHEEEVLRSLQHEVAQLQLRKKVLMETIQNKRIMNLRKAAFVKREVQRSDDSSSGNLAILEPLPKMQ